MSDVCDPRKTGCTAYHFPHRRNSNPDRKCSTMWDLSAMSKVIANMPGAFSDLYEQRWIPSEYVTNANRRAYSAVATPARNCKCVLTPVLKQDR